MSGSSSATSTSGRCVRRVKAVVPDEFKRGVAATGNNSARRYKLASHSSECFISPAAGGFSVAAATGCVSDFLKGSFTVKVAPLFNWLCTCLLYTSDAADDLLCVDL